MAGDPAVADAIASSQPDPPPLGTDRPLRIAVSNKPLAFLRNGSLVGVLTHLLADAA
jgi:hypothetical protein